MTTGQVSDGGDGSSPVPGGAPAPVGPAEADPADPAGSSPASLRPPGGREAASAAGAPSDHGATAPPAPPPPAPGRGAATGAGRGPRVPLRPTSRRARAAARGRVAPHRSRSAAPAASAVAPGAAGPWPGRFPARRATRRRSAAEVGKRRALLLAGMGALTLLGVGLAVGGLSAVRNSTVGRYQTTVAPDEPGYRASVVPTPTLGLLVPDDDGALVGTAVLAFEPGEQGGTVVLVPAATLVDGAGSGRTLADVYAREGPEATSRALGRVLTAAVGETVQADAAVWEQLVEPVGPVEVTLDRAVGDWEAGEVSITPGEVGEFLAALGDGEDEPARTERQQEFWNAWLPMVRDAGESALPGEVESGVGRFVRAIAAGDGVAVGLPVDRSERDDEVAYQVDVGRLGAFVAGAIPFPTAPEPGARIRVRLLNGTGDDELTTAAARDLVAGGAEISVVGNADTLSEPETTLVHRGGQATSAAEWLRAVVGGGRLEVVGPGQPGADDEIDVTVILGQDAGEIFGREQTPD